MLRIIHLTYTGRLRLQDGTEDPFGPWTCIARQHARGYQAYVGGTPTASYHPTVREAVKKAVEMAMCAPVSNLRVVEG